MAWLALAALLWNIYMPHLAGAETVKLGGTGSGLGTLQRLAEAFQQSAPDFTFHTVANLGSSGGLKALEAGVLDLAITSRPLTHEESAQGLIAHSYGMTPFVLVTSQPGVSGFTLSQLVDIYAGKQTTWPDGSRIRLVLRPANDTDTRLLASFSPQMKEALDNALAKEGMIMAITDQDSVQTIKRVPGALGTTSLALLLAAEHPLIPLAIDRISPSHETVANGSYPYIKTLSLVTKGVPTGQVAHFIAFIQSPEGKAILRSLGHWERDSALPVPSNR